MKPATELIKGFQSPNSTYLFLAEEGKQYAGYFVTNMHSGQNPRVNIILDMPAGDYVTKWLNAETEKNIRLPNSPTAAAEC